ncbi:MAG: hypothetical protein ACRDWD_08050, partial [Acidimicrobiia bacterium]
MPAPRRPVPTRLPTGTVKRKRAGAPWWQYERPRTLVPAEVRERAVSAERERLADTPTSPTDASEPSSSQPRGGLERVRDYGRPGVVPGVLAALCLAIVLATARLDVPVIGRLLVPVAAILAAWAFGQVLVRRHPDEPWLAWMLVLGVVVKLLASVLRYYTVVDEYEGFGDATLYDQWGRRYFEAWTTGGEVPDPTGKGSAETNWLRWFTGVVYYVFGPDIIIGFLVFGLFAVVGSYLWY